MGKKKTKVHNGCLYVNFSKVFSGTLIITSTRNESDVYYASINPHSGFSVSFISLPPGNYVLKIMGKDETRLISIAEYTTSDVDWRV